MTNKNEGFNRNRGFNLMMGAGRLVIALVIALVVWGGQRALTNRASARQPLPAMKGEAAIESLKQRGEYASLKRAMETARYRANAEPQRLGHFAALNPAQELHSRFTPQGVEVRRRSDERTPKLAMTLRSVGYGNRQLPVSPGTVTAQDQRIEIHRTVGDNNPQSLPSHPSPLIPHPSSLIPHPSPLIPHPSPLIPHPSPLIPHPSSLTEWYINRPSGLEQGFTISEPPGERRDGERLRLTLELSGEWRAKLIADGQAVEFSEASGGGAVRYDHLAVCDAQGKTLPARMSLAQRELRLEVEDAGAVWPVTIDPTLAQQAYIKASNTGEEDEFGNSVAVSGDTVVVGAFREDSSTTGVNNTPDDSALDSGAAYVFVRSGTTWTQQAYLKASNTGTNDWFGFSVAVSGDTVVVGAPQESSSTTGVDSTPDDSATAAGAAYVFVRSGTAWMQQAYLKASNTGAVDYFGASVAVSGDTVVVGARAEDSSTTGVNSTPNDSATNAGAAYVFVRGGTAWTQQAYLKASNTGTFDFFGRSVAVSVDTVVVGAEGEDSSTTGVNSTPNNSANSAGAAYVFVRGGTTWTQQAYLKASNTGADDLFGESVSVSADTVVVGAEGEDSSAPGVNNDSATAAGAAYVFVRGGTTWTQQAYLKASNTGADDRFGYSVAVSGDMVVVGARGEDGSTTGVNSTPNENAANAGAAYVFVRGGTVWTQQAYLKASNTGASDLFGSSVAVSGGTVVVGAVFEDSGTTGVNSTPDDSSLDTGAAYVFANTPPDITAQAGVSRQQGSPSTNSQIATATDPDDAANTLQLQISSNGVTFGNSATLNGVTVTLTDGNAAAPGTNPDADGKAFADIVAACSANNADFTLRVTDSGGLTATVTINVTVTANTPPVLTYPATPISVANGGGITVNPLTGPSDNGSVSSVSVNSPTFVGMLSVNSAGVVSISNAAPGGTHTVSVTATDNCNATTIATFTLTVGCLNSLTVNNLGDGADAVPGNNVCETGAGNGVCTLRAALQEAHAQIACAPFTINFAVTGTINLNTELSSIYHPDLTLNGPGAQQLTVRSNAATPITIFTVDDNSVSVKKLTVNGLTLRDGDLAVQSGPGGQVTVNDCVVTNNQSGLVVINDASLTVNNSIIAGNTATDAGSVGFGAAVGALVGTLTMTNCTISGNTNTLTGDFQPSALLVANASATLTNCTISGNTGNQTMLLTTFPGSPNNPTLTLTNCTVAGNTLSSATTAYGVLEARGDGVLTSALQLKNTLVAGNTVGLGANFRTATGGTVTSLGNNLDSDGSSGFTNGVNGNLVGTVANPLNALLAALGNYGGTAQTRALLPGSPAINAGTSSGAPATDQRGIARVGNVDIGAFESRGFTLAVAGGNNQSTVTNTAFAAPLSVTVSSANSEPVNGGQVTFTPPGSGASCSLATNPATIAGGAASSNATANAIIGGPYNVSAAANGATSINFSLTNLNTAPTFTPATISQQQGSPAGAAVTIGTVNDAQTPPGSLIVTQIGGGTATGINVTGINNTGGTITAVVTADCNAVAGTVRFQVSDGALTGTGDLTVNVTPNTAPTLAYGNVSLNAGTSTGNLPTTATDNGSINSFAVQSQGGYTGTISVNASGVVSISNATPVGNHTITIRATDNCGAFTDAQFTLSIGNNLPTITPAAALTRQQGSAGSIGTIAAVNDGETPVGNLTVTATTIPAGITVTGITNAAGTISANVSASCSAAVGNNVVVLTVTDGNNGTATANLIVNVTANTAPGLSYPISGVALNSATTINPTTATDNGSITGYQIVSVTPPLTVAPTVNASGVVSVTNAGPFGLHTITVRATDNCGATTETSFTLNVGCGSLTVTPATLINGLTFIPYSSTLSATGGSGTYTFSLASGTLPAGLTLSGNTISGTPNTAGASTFTIRATDDNGCFGEQSYTLLIGSTGLKYYPLARPVRLLDTRPGLSPNACFQPNAPIPGNTARLQPARGVCEGLTIPANATTITGNITTVQSGGGFLTIYPSDAPQPLVANSNYNPNEVLNNAFTVGVGAKDGAVKIFVTSTTDVVVDVTGYYAPPEAGGLYFHPLPRPVRLLETRAGFSGCFAPAQPLPGGVNTIQQGAGSCQGLTIPPDALALVGNATTVNPVGEGYLTLYPANAAQPLVASSNYAAGQVVNGPFTVGLSPSGQFNIFTLRTTDLVVDITGYYSAQANDANGQGLLFTSLGSPLRLLDTRAGQQGCYTPEAPMTTGTIYTQETQSPCTNLTPTARALIGNATVVNTTGEGYLTFWPADATQPLVATSNYVAGQIFNRYFTVGLSGSVSFKRFASRTTDLVIDISGFFAP